MSILYAIGHSTRTFEDLVEVLRAHAIDTLVDIRSCPMSRRLPHFNRVALEKSVPAAGMRYLWMKELGGRRKKMRDDSPHVAIRSDSFRNYADHMLTEEFERATMELVRLAGESRTAYMCAERLFFHCHRMMVSDWLVLRGHQILHLEGPGRGKPHQLTSDARIIGGELIYRGDRLL